MASLGWLSFLILLPTFHVFARETTYIVHIDHNLKPLSFATHHSWYLSHLESLHSDTSSSLLYTYSTAYHGFAASLDSVQVRSLLEQDSVLGVYEDPVYHLHTTHTPQFLGLESVQRFTDNNVTKNLDEASMDITIGFLDTGIWPESKSFDDLGMKPIPKRWKGKCESGVNFNSSFCNKKLIGAYTFSNGVRRAGKLSDGEIDSPMDENGHGTHTASIAAGSSVANASLYGYAIGTARGMAPRARVAIYKVCWRVGCYGSDILAGMERAILDGVNILSLSIGLGQREYFEDPVSIGSFSAVQKGIFVSCSAGNSGPMVASVNNLAPWLTTVGAGTIDRDFPAFALLGNGENFTGTSLFSGTSISKPLTLVYNISDPRARNCLGGSLDRNLVSGNVVLCDRGSTEQLADKAEVVRNADGLGMILANTNIAGEGLEAENHLIPTLAVGKKVGDMIRAYVQSYPNPTVILSFGGTVLDTKPAPVVASFSSRGLNSVTPEILKPDLIAPGVNILGAWSGSVAPNGLESDSRRAKFNILTGTSMACPHISGLAALVKAAHPSWSPNAIKSALMTTAYTFDNTKSPILDAVNMNIATPWGYGSGHVDIQRALDPGLVYDIKSADYITFVCSLGYTINQVRYIVKRNVTCSKRFSNPGQLNYPSFSIVFERNRVVRYTRILLNVGPASSVYNVTVTGPSEVGVTVKPPTLVFKKVGQKVKYTVTFVAEKGITSGVKFGSITWKSARHQVQSPISYILQP